MKFEIKADMPEFIWATSEKTAKYGPYAKGDMVDIPEDLVKELKKRKII